MKAKAKPKKLKPGKKLKLTANVKAVAPAKGDPDGKVVFKIGRKKLGAATLKNGKAKLKTKAPKNRKKKAGTTTVKATYKGSDSWEKSKATLTLKSKKTEDGDEFQVNTYTADAQLEPAAAPLADGGFVVAWASEKQDGAGFGIYGQRYDAADEPAGEEFRINVRAADSQSRPVLAGLKDGGFVAVWQSVAEDRSLAGVSARRFDAKGKPSGPEFGFAAVAESTGDPAVPNVAALEDGGFVIVWAALSGAGARSGILARRFDAAGKAGDTATIASAVAGDDPAPAVTGLEDGGFVVTWVSGTYADAYRIDGRRYNARGKPR
jgi:hypothetical protein